jgi:hypothetical protein
MQQRRGTTAMHASQHALPLRRPPQVSPRRIVGFRPARPRYNRAADLAGLLPLWPEELADASIAGRTKLVQMLLRALRAERQRGVGGHWAYDLSRHASLVSALRAERAALSALMQQRAGGRRVVARLERAKLMLTRNTVAIPQRDLQRDLAGLP